jgi:hypothetical protein
VFIYEAFCHDYNLSFTIIAFGKIHNEATSYRSFQ